MIIIFSGFTNCIMYCIMYIHCRLPSQLTHLFPSFTICTLSPWLPSQLAHFLPGSPHNLHTFSLASFIICTLSPWLPSQLANFLPGFLHSVHTFFLASLIICTLRCATFSVISSACLLDPALSLCPLVPQHPPLL